MLAQVSAEEVRRRKQARATQAYTRAQQAFAVAGFGARLGATELRRAVVAEENVWQFRVVLSNLAGEIKELEKGRRLAITKCTDVMKAIAKLEAKLDE